MVHVIACNGAYKRLGVLHCNARLEVSSVGSLSHLVNDFGKDNEISLGWVFPRIWVFLDKYYVYNIYVYCFWLFDFSSLKISVNLYNNLSLSRKFLNNSYQS